MAPLVGLGRTVMSEYPQLYLTQLDLDEPFSDLASLMAQLLLLGDEQELRLTQGQLQALRLRTGESGVIPATISNDTPAKQRNAFELLQETEGRIESLFLQACEHVELGPLEVEIQVEVASLHFKDVMKSLGLLSERVRANTYFGDQIGMEGTGIVSAVGSDVTLLQPGDKV